MRFVGVAAGGGGRRALRGGVEGAEDWKRWFAAETRELGRGLRFFMPSFGGRVRSRGLGLGFGEVGAGGRRGRSLTYWFVMERCGDEVDNEGGLEMGTGRGRGMERA